MRPIGGWLFGRIADRVGRRTSMVISVLMMCVGSLLIGILPTYEHVGTLAPVLLLLARMLQGLSVGGEYGTSATYMSEVAIKGAARLLRLVPVRHADRRPAPRVPGPGLLQTVMTGPELTAWGWRIPFFIGAGLAIVALYLRLSLAETRRQQRQGDRRNLLRAGQALAGVPAS